jgi:hypothetical protein
MSESHKAKYRSPISIIFGYQERVNSLGVVMECAILFGALSFVFAIYYLATVILAGVAA